MTYNVITAKNLGIKLMEWHGGQNTALYAVASSLVANKCASITRDMVDRSKLELWACDSEDADSLAESLETFYANCF